MAEGAGAGAIEAGRAFVEIFADDLGLKTGLERANARMRKWAATISKIGLGVVGAGSAIVAPLLWAGVEAAEYGHHINDAAEKTGLAVSEIAGLTYAAKLAGSSIESLETGIKKMQVTLALASRGGKQAVAALDRIGLSVGDIIGLSPDAQFKLTADHIAALPDPMLRAAAAVSIFGKSGADLLPILMKGGAGIAKMQKEADDLDITLSANLASSVGDVGELIGRLTMQFSALKTVVGVAIAVALRSIITFARPTVATWIRWIAANQNLVKTLLYVGAGLIVIGGTL